MPLDTTAASAREERENERAFVHCGSSGLNHAITSESATDIMQLPPRENRDDLYATLNWFSED